MRLRNTSFVLALQELALICYESNVAPWMDPDAVAFRNAKNDLIAMYRAASADADQRNKVIAELTQETERLRKALAELVACKDSPLQGYFDMTKGEPVREVKAWAAARAALSFEGGGKV